MQYEIIYGIYLNSLQIMAKLAQQLLFTNGSSKNSGVAQSTMFDVSAGLQYMPEFPKDRL